MALQTSSKLSRLIWLGRLRIALLVMAGFLFVAGVLAFFTYSENLPDDAGNFGTVDSWTRVQTESGSSTYVINVTLEDGRKVSATAPAIGRAPKNGERIRLAKSKTAFGRIRYRWNRKPVN